MAGVGTSEVVELRRRVCALEHMLKALERRLRALEGQGAGGERARPGPAQRRGAARREME